MKSAASPRALAAAVLVAVLRDNATLSIALQERMLAQSAGCDAALVQELCYGTIRFQPRLEFWLEQLLQHTLRRRDFDIHALMLIGLYQLTEMRMPAHAVLHETAEACRHLRKEWAVKLVNAILRRFQREHARFQSELSSQPTARYAHPSWLIESIQTCWPQDWQAILEANNSRPPLTLRVNRRIVTRDELIFEWARVGIVTRPCLVSAVGVVPERPMHVELLPGFGEGRFSVQDEAAQLAAELLGVAPGMRVLDACAAPGGKTCHLLERYPDLDEVVALDKDLTRVGRIYENLRRLGLAANVIVADAADPDGWWDGRRFERILLDAPCSASGVIRRHPDIKLRRGPADITVAALQQARLLKALWPLLTPGGKLLYATCSVLRQENSKQIEAFLAVSEDAKLVEIDADWGVNAVPGRQILSGQGGMDGFYYALIQKN